MTWNRKKINELLRTNDRAVERAMLRLHDLQTNDEQTSNSTKYLNNQGFSAAHANKGSYYARWVRSGRRLSGRHLDKAREIALYHSKQLVRLANG